MTKPKPLLSVVHTLGVMFYASFAWVVFWGAIYLPMVNTPLSTLLFALVIWVIGRSAFPRAVYAARVFAHPDMALAPKDRATEAERLAREFDLWIVRDDGTLETWHDPAKVRADEIHRQLHMRRLLAQPDVGTQVKVGDDLDATWELLYGERPNSDQFKRAYRLRREETYRKAAGYVTRWRDPL